MSLVKTVHELGNWLDRQDRRNKTLGFVPTMGCLHEGHLSLIREAKANNDLVAVSIFVNPTQFGPNEDYARYPRNVDRDYRLALEAGADIVFNPEIDEIYVPGSSTEVEVKGELTEKLCGASRPTHFKGVTTVVNILFHIIGPDRAYFGQKDAQQALVIQKMVRDLHIPVEIVVCPIVREADGLAMSSRNIYLNPQERRQAPALNRALHKARDYYLSGMDGCNNVGILTSIVKKEIQKEPLAVIDYIQILDADTLEDIQAITHFHDAIVAVAVYFGKNRLIDNIILKAGDVSIC